MKKPGMSLPQLLAGFDLRDPVPPIEIADIASNSARVTAGCAFVALKPSQALGFEDMQRYLTERQVAKNYWPERLELMDALPRTPSGKIQKFKLREIASTFEGS